MATSIEKKQTNNKSQKSSCWLSFTISMQTLLHCLLFLLKKIIKEIWTYRDQLCLLWTDSNTWHLNPAIIQYTDFVLYVSVHVQYSVICTDNIHPKIKEKLWHGQSLGTDLHRGDLDDYTPWKFSVIEIGKSQWPINQVWDAVASAQSTVWTEQTQYNIKVTSK